MQSLLSLFTKAKPVLRRPALDLHEIMPADWPAGLAGLVRGLAMQQSELRTEAFVGTLTRTPIHEDLELVAPMYVVLVLVHGKYGLARIATPATRVILERIARTKVDWIRGESLNASDWDDLRASVASLRAEPGTGSGADTVLARIAHHALAGDMALFVNELTNLTPESYTLRGFQSDVAQLAWLETLLIELVSRIQIEARGQLLISLMRGTD